MGLGKLTLRNSSNDAVRGEKELSCPTLNLIFFKNNLRNKNYWALVVFLLKKQAIVPTLSNGTLVNI